MSVTDGISLKQYVCFTAQPQCKIGTPLEGVSCGGLGPTGPIGCLDPRYECVGEALAYDGPGVCCLKSDPGMLNHNLT